MDPFSKVTFHSIDNEITSEKKYEINYHDGCINLTGVHQLDETKDIISTGQILMTATDD